MSSMRETLALEKWRGQRERERKKVKELDE